MHVLWTDLLHPGVPLLEKVIRTVIVYFFLLAGLRLAGKRELGQLNPFDLVVLLVLSNTVQNAIIGNDNSMLGGLVGAAVLLVLNYAVVRYLFMHPKLDRLAEGRSVILVRDGHVMERHLRRELITRGELESAARRQGIDDLSQVQCCRLEVGGSLTFVMQHPTDDERRFRDLMRRLERIESLLTAREGDGTGLGTRESGLGK
ncbi:MAG TPA: YetF domain-containing protein [Gemmatimonadaceae bacterium]|nr:YetF domain-containing protein [Gemmatimonadaceae bacterium]